MRPFALIASLALILTAVAGATTARGTLTGTVTRGPITPVCAAEQPCDAPAAHVTLVFSHAARDVAHVTTGADGRYRLRLAAGLYGVRRLHSTTPDRKLEPKSVRVRVGRVSRIDFSIDTGIR
jgi:hypothetical protein